MFRKEWPAATAIRGRPLAIGSYPALSRFGLPCSVIVVSTFIGPGWLPEQVGSLHKAGVGEDDKD
jgi:hypothetical protein